MGGIESAGLLLWNVGLHVAVTYGGVQWSAAVAEAPDVGVVSLLLLYLVLICNNAVHAGCFFHLVGSIGSISSALMKGLQTVAVYMYVLGMPLRAGPRGQERNGCSVPSPSFPRVPLLLAPPPLPFLYPMSRCARSLSAILFCGNQASQCFTPMGALACGVVLAGSFLYASGSKLRTSDGGVGEGPKAGDMEAPPLPPSPPPPHGQVILHHDTGSKAMGPLVDCSAEVRQPTQL